MAQVKAFTVPGVRLIIPSGDHRPPHFHATRPGDWSVKVCFMESGVMMFRHIRPRGARMGATERKAIIEGVETHRLALLAEWEACQDG